MHGAGIDNKNSSFALLLTFLQVFLPLVLEDVKLLTVKEKEHVWNPWLTVMNDNL
jgi:hypothetical protein